MLENKCKVNHDAQANDLSSSIKRRKSMRIEHQMNFFEADKKEIAYVREEVIAVKESNDKTRRSLYARHSELAKKYEDLTRRFEHIERNICKRVF
jgi:Holliday junction resolvase-like predicted endonuclease